MSETKDWNDDPRILAYALGELEGTDRDEIERALESDPACRAALDEIRAFLPELEVAVRAGAADAGLESEARDRIAEAARQGPSPMGRIHRPIWRQPAFAAAAAVALALVGVRLGMNRGSTADVEVATGVDTAYEALADEAKDAAQSEWRPIVEVDETGKMVMKKGAPKESRASRGMRRMQAPGRAEELASNARSKSGVQDGATAGLPGSDAPTSAPVVTPRMVERGRPEATLEEDFEAGAPPVTAAADPSSPTRSLNSEVQPQERMRRRELLLDQDVPEGEVAPATEAPVDALELEFVEQLADEDDLTDLVMERQRLRAELPENPFVLTESDPLSTFSIDVDTASYSNVRRAIQDGRRPSPFDVRIEEFVNYFSYDDPAPTADDVDPFKVTIQSGGSPWAPQNRLVRIGLKGREIEYGERAPANLVFLIDVSGSMDSEDKLPLVKDALAMLTDSLEPNDRVAIVVYASARGLALPSTPIAARESILQALEKLDAGGSTNGGAGIELAYSVATEHFVEGGVNRVVLCTDGDFNVGVTSDEALEDLIAEKARSGIDLTVLGFGTGNFQDQKMERLSNRGNGNFAYIDSHLEAKKVLVTEVGGTLNTIAKDVKIQVKWNPSQVRAARLIGYENRVLEHADFRDDSKDAGEIGAGHGVTALYEVVPFGAPLALDGAEAGDPDADALAEAGGVERTGPLVTVFVRYKRPGEETSVEMEVAGIDAGQSFGGAPESLRFSAAVAAFGMLLRESDHVGETTFGDVRTWALESVGGDQGGLREAFVQLVQRSIELGW